MIQQPKKKFKVLLIGDVCKDITLNCIQRRENPEADAPLVEVESKDVSLGMAGFVETCLNALNIDVCTVYPTVLGTKTRYMLNGTQLLRVDADVPVNMEKYTVTEAMLTGIDAVVVSDYNKGAVPLPILIAINDLCKKLNKPLFVDTKKTDIGLLDHAIIKINELEASRVKKWPMHPVVITLGNKGYEYGPFKGEALQVKAVDVCGAGDAFLAGMVYGFLSSSGSMAEALRVGNYNAGLSVQAYGKYAPTRHRLKEYLQ